MHIEKMLNKKVCFVIYGAASGIVEPIFQHFSNSDYVCIINQSQPDYLLGRTLKSGVHDFEKELAESVSSISDDVMIVFVNAAVFQVDKLFVGLEPSEIDKMLESNLHKPIAITGLLMREMLKRKCGRMINLTSFRADAPTGGTSLYSGVKAFGNAFYKGLALEYGRFDITCNNVSIGFSDTKLLGSLGSEKFIEIKKKISKKKFLPEEEFIGAITYLINSNYVNGSTLDITGGLNFLDV
jgi:3-oxoacyl-[acyl-carrier protein] reductase